MNVTATDVLGALFNPTDTVCFRVFEDKKTGIFQGAKLSCECGKYKSIEETLKNHNAMQRGIFFVVNYGGQDDAAITRINAQFFEMDDGTFEEQQKKVDAFPLPPSMVIKTQKSLHVYYFMDSSAKVERFREIQKRLVKHFGGDPMCVNESRVMRLPGFQHCKKEPPVEVTCISFHPERKYTQEQLTSVLPEVEGAPAERRNGTAKGLEQVCRACDFIKHCRENASSLSEHDWYAMITNLAPFDGGTARIHELSLPYPRYSEADTQRKINHFLESGTKPMTCRTIAEKGFKCPKAGKCPVKSPAALCFHPMEIHVLLEILQELPVTGEPVTDLQTANTFMLDYLYNQDMVTADAMIQSNIRDHFKLPPTFLKSLQTAFKAENKAFRKKMEARKARALKSLPEWYEVIDAGVRFLPGVLAKALAKNEKVFYAAEQHFRYQGGVYVEMAEMEAQRLVQEQMLIRETKMSQIVDAEKQWRLLVQRDIRELNANPYIINVRNGLYNVLEDTDIVKNS